MVSHLVRRREFLELFAVSMLPAAWVPREVKPANRRSGANHGSFFFTSQGKTGLMKTDGTGLRYLNFDVHRGNYPQES